MVGQVLLTAHDIVRQAGYRNAQRTMYRLLELGVVPIVNENDTVATEELRFGDNDRLAALVAHLVHADALVLLSDVPGLYDGAPSRPQSQLDRRSARPDDVGRCGRLPARDVGTRLRRHADQDRSGTGGRRSGDPGPAGCDRRRRGRSGRRTGRDVLPSDREEGSHLVALVGSRRIVRRVAGTGRRGRDRSGRTPQVAALPEFDRFAANSPRAIRVDLLDENGRVVARGLVNFDSTELPGLLGRSTRELAAELGSAYEREIVHRDDLVVLA